MIEKCKFHMAVNHLKIDFFEIFGGIDNSMYFNKYFGSISLKFLPHGGSSAKGQVDIF